MVEHRFGSQREWMIQGELERQKGMQRSGQERPRKCSRAEPPGTLFLVHENVFRLCKPRFLLDIEMITFS
jgi:hypothetical protein